MFKNHWTHFLIFTILVLIISFTLICLLFPSYLQLPEEKEIPIIPAYPSRIRVSAPEFTFDYYIYKYFPE